jgi:hypothetical protein
MPDLSTVAQSHRLKAIELAIKEVEAYKTSEMGDGYTTRLLKSAEAIAEYINSGAIPEK